MRTITEIVDELIAMLENLSLIGALTEKEENTLNGLLFEYAIWVSVNNPEKEVN